MQTKLKLLKFILSVTKNVSFVSAHARCRKRDKDVFALWERFKTPKQCVVAYKGGTLDKKLSIQLQIPYVNLEDFGCPKFEYLYR